MATTDTAPQRQVEEPFVVTAMLSLVAASAWLALRPELLLGFYYDPRLLALTHLVTLGFISSIMMGVQLRLLPMSLKVEPLSRRLAVTQFVLFLIGFTGMVAHFGRSEWVPLAWSGVLVLVAAVLQTINFARLWPLAWRGDWVARHVIAAHLNFVLIAALGVTFGMQNAGYGWTADLFAGSILDRLSAHLHLGAVGWVTTMIFGLQLKLVPTTAGPAWSRWPRFVALQLGTLGLVASLLWWPAGQRLFGPLLAGAIVWQAIGPVRAIARRPQWLWETTALGLLVALAVCGLLLAFDIPQPLSQWRHRLQLAYGYAALFGWVLVTTGAVAFKLFPLWVWKERFEPDWGKKPVPAVSELASPRLRHVSGAALVGGVLTVATGVVLADHLLTSVGTKLVLVGVIAFVVNFVRTARWALLDLEYEPRPPADHRGPSPPS